MTSDLPPSKFGPGHTYGEDDQWDATLDGPQPPYGQTAQHSPAWAPDVPLYPQAQYPPSPAPMMPAPPVYGQYTPVPPVQYVPVQPVAMYPAYGYAVQSPTNGMAIAALIMPFVCLGFPLGIIFGHVARSQIRRTGEQGDGLALAGLILSYISAGGLLIYLIAILSWANAASSSY